MSDDAETFVAGPHHIETASGRYVDLMNPDPATIVLEDIAAHLSRIGRFTGASVRFYSVAEHVLLVADRLWSLGYGPEVILLGLHHDDAEAYVGDVSRPLKLAIKEAYGSIEVQVERAIEAALELPTSTAEARAAVKAVDDWALSAEAYHLLPSKGRGWFVEGLYRPERPQNSPVSSRRMLPEPALDPALVERLYLKAHHRWGGPA